MSPPTVPVAGPAPAPVTGTGRIKALGINYADFGYLADGQTMYHDGIGAGASATEALIFSYVRLDNDLFEIEIKRSDGKPQLLGVHWDSSDPSVSVGSLKYELSSSSSEKPGLKEFGRHAVLAVFNYEGLLRSSKAGWPGPGYTRIWKIKPDNTLCPYFVEKDVEKPLRLLLHAASSSQRRAVDVAADPGAFLIKWGEGGGWVLVVLHIHKRMSASEDIVFDGGEGQCERFIRLVRKAAFAQGKLEDSKWVAMFASTCFEGKALRWYSALDSATKVDWHLLEPALLAEFSGPVLSGQAEEKMPSVERESSIPTPAAAPPPSATGWESSRPSSPTAYEPSAAATAPPEPPLPSAPWPPPSAATPTESNAGPAPPPPPRKNTSTSSYQTGSSFRPPPRHPSAASGSSPSVAPSPGLYGSHIPAQNPAAAPPPPPSRINSFKAQSPQDQWKNEVPSPSQPG
ncbi:hypothetical protein FRB90_009188, partial [Tulasnella sp. 427]